MILSMYKFILNLFMIILRYIGTLTILFPYYGLITKKWLSLIKISVLWAVSTFVMADGTSINIYYKTQDFFGMGLITITIGLKILPNREISNNRICKKISNAECPGMISPFSFEVMLFWIYWGTLSNTGILSNPNFWPIQLKLWIFFKKDISKLSSIQKLLLRKKKHNITWLKLKKETKQYLLAKN